MMAVILAASAGFLAGAVVVILAVLLLRWRSGATARAKAKEFTQYMILSDNAILWFISVSYVGLAAYSIYRNYTGALPWLTSGQALAFTGWATVQTFLIRKSEKQNSKGGITYDLAMKEREENHGES